MRAYIRGSEMPYFSHLVTMQEEEKEEEEDNKSVKVEITSITPVLLISDIMSFHHVLHFDVHKSQIEWNLKVKCQISV